LVLHRFNQWGKLFDLLLSVNEFLYQHYFSRQKLSANAMMKVKPHGSCDCDRRTLQLRCSVRRRPDLDEEPTFPAAKSYPIRGRTIRGRTRRSRFIGNATRTRWTQQQADTGFEDERDDQGSNRPIATLGYESASNRGTPRRRKSERNKRKPDWFVPWTNSTSSPLGERGDVISPLDGRTPKSPS